MTNQLMKESVLKSSLQFFDYGILNRSCIPSAIDITKRNLSQNAAQSMCLFLHIPFIFYQFKDNNKLHKMWENCVRPLQIITQIAYSHKINEEDLVVLQCNVELHLKCIQEYFGVELLPKHHNLLHLGTLIRRMGPVVFLSMMRYEAKHKVLKAIANQTANFRNISKTIAIMHQQMISTCTQSYADNIKHGKLFKISEDLRNNVELESQSLEIFETKWLKFNEWIYRKGLFIFKHRIFCKIENILFDKVEYSFVVSVFRTVDINSFLNSAEIEEIFPKKYEIIKLNEMENKKVYEKKTLAGKCFIIIDCLETKHSFFG